MPKIYPEDRKFSVKQVYAHFNSIRKTADILEVSKSTVHRWLNDATKSIPPSTPQIIKSTRSTKLMEINDLVDASIQLDAFLTCRKLQAIILENMSISVSKELVRLAIIKLGYTRKKARFYGLAKNVLQLNRKFIQLRDSFIAKGHPVFSIDETGFGRFSYNKAYGRYKKGVPLFVRKVKPRMTTISVIACASKDGWVDYKIIHNFT